MNADNFMSNVIFESEDALAQRVGVSRDRLRAFRLESLTEFEHWKKKGRNIVWLEEGVHALAAALGLEIGPPALDGDPEKNGAKKGPVTLVAVRMPVNRRLVLACEPERWPGSVAPRDLVRVRVRDNGNFVAGMKMELRCVHVAADLFDHVGNMPRRKGAY